ncbi:hypothetical protein M0657_001868 [Pyricularia oryzae]|nr:hypothetical protein M0657_001868 [Pyricularia oryzae]
MMANNGEAPPESTSQTSLDDSAKALQASPVGGPGVWSTSGTSTPKTDDPSQSDDGPPTDLEGLHRESTGPVYSTFSTLNKKWIIGMVSFSSFISPMTANIYFPSITPIANELGVSIGLMNLTITTYMIMQGLSPTIIGDLGDMTGRRPAFIVAFTIYIVANIGLALQSNYAALLVLRCVQGAGSSGTLALGFAVVADLAVSAERGKYMGFVGAGIQVGPSIGPVIGGALSEYLGWRSIFWFCAILTIVWLIPFILAVPETCRKVVGNGSVPPQGWNRTLVDYIQERRHPTDRPETPKRKFYFPNPFKTLAVVFEKDLGLLLMLNASVYLMFMLILATMSPQLHSIYNLNEFQVGLCYLPYGFGCFFSAIVQGYLLDWNYRRTARKVGMKIDMKRGDDLTKFPIEKARIQLIAPMLGIGIISTICYSWIMQTEQALGLVLFFGFLIGVTVNGSFSMMNTLIVDLYTDAPATAVAANNLFRCSLGAICMSFIENMVQTMGRGWCYTFWALLTASLMPILWLLVQRGPRWREERRLRKEKIAQKELAQQDAEKSGK